MDSHAYEPVNRAWKATTRIVFGEELGELADYEGWLLSNVVSPRLERSSGSQEKVYLGSGEYCKGRFLGFAELNFARKPEPVNINEIKDIDSIIESLRERFYYAGNIILGNSRFVEESANVNECHYVLRSTNISTSKYVACSSDMKECEYMFGCNMVAETRHCVKNYETYHDARCFELWASRYTTDSYFVYGIENCSDCMFSFNLRNASHCIGNISLGKEKYSGLKQKLLAELLGELKRKREFPSLVELVTGSVKDSGNIPEFSIPREKAQAQDMEPIESAFRKTTRVVLGRELRNVADYDNYFHRHIKDCEAGKTILGEPTSVAHYASFEKFPRDRLVKYESSFLVGRMTCLDAGDLASLGSIVRNLHKISFFNTDPYFEECHNAVGCPVVFKSSHGYRSSLIGLSRYVMFSFWPRRCEYVIGCALPYLSTFVLNCYYSSRLSRAFEVDGSRDCTDIYFSHNCEAVQDGLFCFNAKNLRRAIGNAEYPPDEYKKFKGSLLGQISSELEKNKTLKWDIYNIRCGK